MKKLPEDAQRFLDNVGASAVAGGFPGMLIGQGSAMAAEHPYGSGIVGAAIGAGVGIAGALVHRAGEINERKRHNALNENQFKDK